MWITASKKAGFYTHPVPVDTPSHRARARFSKPTDAVVFTLFTTRSHDQYNTTIYGLDDRYRGVKGGRRVIFVNESDIAGLGFSDGDHVDLISEWPQQDGSVEERRADNFRIVAYSTPVGNAAAYYPETNPLIPLDHVAVRSNTPVSKAVLIRLEPATD